MAAVNWFCLVLAFGAFIKINVCIKVDPNEIPNENYTTISLNSHTIQPYAKSTIISNKTNNFKLLGDIELSASERTRRLIPYMAFYVPVSELPINKQYVHKNNIHATKQLAGPAGPTGSLLATPTQYFHSGLQYLTPAPSATSSIGGQQHYHPNAGLSIYHTHGHVGQQAQQKPQHQQQQQQQQQFHLVPPSIGHSQHLLPPEPPVASAAVLPSLVGRGKGSGNNHNVYVTYNEVNPVRQRTVQYFPPLSSTATATANQQHKVHQHSVRGNSGQSNNAADAIYRPRTKQSKINLTPFTPSNTVPGDFVPIVYTPVNNNKNNNNNNNNYNNNILSSHNAGEEEINDSSFNQDDGNQQYHKQQTQQQHNHHHQHQHQQKPQQIAIEYSSGLLPPSGSAAPISPLDVPQRHHHNQQQLQQVQQQQHDSQQQSQYYSATQSPVNVDLTHDVVGGVGVGTIISGDSINSAAISPPSIYHQNQHHHQYEQQRQPEHVIIDASLRTSQQPQTVTDIGSQHQQQQQLLNGGSKSAIHFQPPKPDSFFESEIQVQHQNQQQQHHYTEQVLKDVNSHSIKNSQMLTPQEKYVMYLQQRLHYNKNQQRYHATRQKQHQQNPSQIVYLSSTLSPPTHGTMTVIGPIRPSQPPLHYDANYPQQNPINHNLYPKPSLKPTGGAIGEEEGANVKEAEEHIITIPVHSLFGEMETLQQQQHNHYPQYSFNSSPLSKHKTQYSTNGPSKPQYNDYSSIDEPKQSLDDEQQQQHQHQLQKDPPQLDLLKPTLGPPTHAFILVTTAAPPYKSKPKIILQPVLREKNVNNYPTIREQTEIPSPPPPPKSHQFNEDDEKPKYVYVKEEFGQKLSTAVKLKPLNKYKSDENEIPQQRHHQQQHQQEQQQQQEQLYDDLPLEPLAPKLPTTQHQHQHHHHHNYNEVEANVPVTPPKTILADPNDLPDIRTSSLAEILHKLQESNHLPHTLTPDNIDNSIKTLIRILNNLKQTQTIVANPPQHHDVPAHSHPSSPDYDYTTGSEEAQQKPQPHDLSLLTPTAPNKHPGPSTGRPGIDYPNYADIPQTSFECSQQRYKGFFGDPETNCQVWHYCDLNGGKASFLCPNGTIFSQIALTCDWWFNVKCATTPQLYVLNERLYKYILPFTPKFPEDYSGPLVDKYLAMKFQEMEEKMRSDKEQALQEEQEAEEPATATEQPIEAASENSKDDIHSDEATTAKNEENRHVKSHSPAKHHKLESVNSQVSEQSSERNLLIDDEVDDISQRGTVDNFESTTIATMTATKKPEPISFSLKPIIVSSTLGPDYDDDHLQHHDNEKRSHENPLVAKETKNSETVEETDNDDTTIGGRTEKEKSPIVPTPFSPNKMQITVEKLDVIEIKPDGATGHIIRDMLLSSKQTN